VIGTGNNGIGVLSQGCKTAVREGAGLRF